MSGGNAYSVSAQRSQPFKRRSGFAKMLTSRWAPISSTISPPSNTITCVCLGMRLPPLGWVRVLCPRFGPNRRQRHALVGIFGLGHQPVEQPGAADELQADHALGHRRFPIAECLD